MSALRISRPGHPTELIVIDDGAVGRVTFTRYQTKGSAGAETWTRGRSGGQIGDEPVRKNPDNGAVEGIHDRGSR